MPEYRRCLQVGLRLHFARVCKSHLAAPVENVLHGLAPVRHPNSTADVLVQCDQSRDASVPRCLGSIGSERDFEPSGVQSAEPLDFILKVAALLQDQSPASDEELAYIRRCQPPTSAVEHLGSQASL